MRWRENLYYYASMFFGVIYLLAFLWIFISAILLVIFCAIDAFVMLIPVSVVKGLMVSFGLSFGLVFVSFGLAEAVGSAANKEYERQRIKKFDLR